MRRIIFFHMLIFTVFAAKAQDINSSFHMTRSQDVVELRSEGLRLYFNRKYEEALPLISKAADQKDPTATFYMGEFYDRGRAVGKDAAVAFEWYLKAAEQGDEDAMRTVFLRLRDGVGVKRNQKEAYRWKYRWDQIGKQKAKEYRNLHKL